ncbi:MAG: hypothetical protein Ta2F_09890 [Termitinemataceae bacterium]|nr:MAG: hypothetical protein Ta2F_09890 [Termitinemataceae bacterium]
MTATEIKTEIKKENKNDKLITLVIALISISGMSFFGFLFWKDINITLVHQNEKPVATVVNKVKTVQRRFEDRVIWDIVVNAADLYNNDTIRTDSGSAVRIKLSSGDIIDLGENSLVKIYLDKSGAGEIELQQGSVSAISISGTLSIIKEGSVITPLEEGEIYASSDEAQQEIESMLEMREILDGPVQQTAINAFIEPIGVQTLGTPENLSPHDIVLRDSELLKQRRINFSWSPVDGADAYIWTLINTDKNVEVRKYTLSDSNYVFTDLRLFAQDKNFSWQVEPVQLDENGNITLRGEIAEGIFYLPSIGSAKPKKAVVIDE